MASSYSAGLTTDNVALILADHLVGTINWAGELESDSREQLRPWARTIARFAKGAGIPVVLTSSLGTEPQGQPGACTRQAAANSRERLHAADIEICCARAVITHLLNSYKNPAAAAFGEAPAKEGVYESLGKGKVRLCPKESKVASPPLCAENRSCRASTWEIEIQL
jgi:hypothetical protein